MAISDLHLASAVNRAAFEGLPEGGDDWLILAGDVAEDLDHLAHAFRTASQRYARVIWTPGNHELWTVTKGDRLAGPRKYEAIVELARSYGVVTPEDPYQVWKGEGGPCVIVPLFLLYDYTFRPQGMSRDEAVAWAQAAGAVSESLNLSKARRTCMGAEQRDCRGAGGLAQ